MTSCAAELNDPFRCPTKWQLWRQILALLPRGRAFQTHEAGAEFIRASESSEFGKYELGSTGLGTEPIVERLTGQQQFWAAYAEVLEHMHQRACALLEEFFCATTVELREQWGVEYGFPDSCEPWDTLCDKVRAEGGATCAYLTSLAARIGWVIQCTDCLPTDDCAGYMVAGCNEPCVCTPNVIYIRVLRGLSPAFTGNTQSEALAGVMEAGCNVTCDPAPEQVVCLIERFKPAHVKAIYEVI